MNIIDPTLNKYETTQSELRKHYNLVNFIKTYCQEKAYSFQVIKIYNITTILSLQLLN